MVPTRAPLLPNAKENQELGSFQDRAVLVSLRKLSAKHYVAHRKYLGGRGAGGYGGQMGRESDDMGKVSIP